MLNYNFHKKLIDQGRSLGYPIVDGVCVGFSMRWIEACLTNQMETFMKYASLIEKGSSQKKRIDGLREEVIQHHSLSREKQMLLDFPAFYEGMLLYQLPLAYKDVLHRSIYQYNLDEITPFASSEAIEKAHGLACTHIQSDAYNESELHTYLDQLASIIDKSGSPSGTKTTVRISGLGHTIAAAYDVNTKQWTVMDINQWPPKSEDSTTAAKKIFDAFSSQQQRVPIASLLIMPANQKDKKHSKFIKEKIKLWQEENCEKHIPVDIENKTLAELIKLAMYHNDTIVLKRIGAEKVTSCEGLNTTLLRDAVLQGSVDVIRLLHDEWAVNLDITVEEGSLAHYAAHAGQASVIEVLHAAGVNLSRPDDTGNTPMHVAAYAGHVNVITALYAAGVELNPINQKSEATPLFYAAQEGHIEVIEKIAELCPHVDKDFALFIMKFNQHTTKNEVSVVKMGLANIKLNILLVDNTRTPSEKINAFLNDQEITHFLKQHRGFFRYAIQNKLGLTIGDTHSFTQFKKFKEKIRAEQPKDNLEQQIEHDQKKGF